MFIWFLEQENKDLDPQIMILHEVISEILEISDFEAAILIGFFSGNIANMIPEGPSNKMLSLGGGGGGGGGCTGTPLADGLVWYRNRSGVVNFLQLHHGYIYYKFNYK